VESSKNYARPKTDDEERVQSRLKEVKSLLDRDDRDARMLEIGQYAAEKATKKVMAFTLLGLGVGVGVAAFLMAKIPTAAPQAALPRRQRVMEIIRASVRGQGLSNSAMRAFVKGLPRDDQETALEALGVNITDLL
jgi:hypothetical protein